MEKLSKIYLDKLNQIKEAIQDSEILTRYLEEEEEEIYKELQLTYEPAIDELYSAVAAENPLQLISLENELLDDGFEGLFLPRILGYSVMRDEVSDQYKYVLPQDHFKKILLCICNSSNFEILKQRIGQTIQIGFGLSSDIWITNLFNKIENKRVRQFLEDLRLEKYRDIRSRHTAYVKYKKQFENFNFKTSNFPSNKTELNTLNAGLKSFLFYRAISNYDNNSFKKYLSDFIANDSHLDQKAYLEIFLIICMFYDLDPSDIKTAQEQFGKLSNAYKDFDNFYFKVLHKFLTDPQISIGPDQDNHMSNIVDKTSDSEVTKYYALTEKIHGFGYVHEEAIEAVQNYYDRHQGLSIQNECVRIVIFQYFSGFLSNMEVTDYQDYFDINKIFVLYMSIFSNEKFNQKVKALSLIYIKKLLKHYTDKRAKDYQDIKKFVKTTFLDLGFMKEKELVELFKTRRKKN